MNYILFAFGEYKENPQALNLLTETVSQISKGEIKFQHGDSGVIITFGTKLDWEDIDDYMKKNIVKLTAMYFVFPIESDMIYSMDEDIKKHLFENMLKYGTDMIKWSKWYYDETDIQDTIRHVFNYINKKVDIIYYKLNRYKQTCSLILMDFDIVSYGKADTYAKHIKRTKSKNV
jgi:hypothetical protein